MAEITSNKEAIQAAEDIQDQTKAALLRIQQHASQAEEVGAATLVQLKEQKDQVRRIQTDAEDLRGNLNTTTKLHNRFDRWAGHWGGGLRRRARAEAKTFTRATERARQKAQIGKENARSAASSVRNVVEDTFRASESRKNVSPDPLAVVGRSSKEQGAQNELDDESRKGLERLEETDKEIDSLLDQADSSLDKLLELSIAMGDEAKEQIASVEKVVNTMDKVNTKQAEVNARTKGLLVGRWRKRADQGG